MADAKNPFVRFGKDADITRIAIAGDWHGDSYESASLIRKAKDEGAQLLIQLGDFGLWPGPSGKNYLLNVDEAATACNLPVYWLDGNHEDFDQIEQVAIDPITGLQPFGRNLYRLPRGSRWEWSGVRFAAVGGATSLDKPSRREGISWWPQEELTRQQIDTLKAQALEFGVVDVLLSHDAPTGVSIPGIKHRQYDPSWHPKELERAWDHRDLFAEVVRLLSPTHIFHGHFHLPSLVYTDSFATRTKSVGLPDSSWRGENMVVLDTAQIKQESEILRARV